MTLTSIIVRKTFAEGTIKAIISTTVDGVLALHDIKVIDNGNKVFIAFPSRSDSKGNFMDIAHPIGQEARENFEKCLLDAYYSHIKSFEI